MTRGVFNLACLGLLSGSDMVCPEEDAIYKCTRGDETLLDWMITSTCGSLDYWTSFSSSSSVGESIVGTLCSTTLIFTVTSLTSSSISGALTIHTPALLNGTRISYGGKTVSCMYVLSSSKLLQLQRMNNSKLKGE